MPSNSTAAGTSAALSKHPFLLSVEQLKQELTTDLDTGLSSVDAQTLQKQHGANRLNDEGGVKWYRLLLKQISNAMILVLTLAMALSYGVTDYVEGGVITAVIVLNVSIGFYQEYQAEQKMDSLRSLASPSANVLRDGNITTIPSGEVVPGDVVLLKDGDTVPADLRLFEAMNLDCDEKILTGEAMPVTKGIEVNPQAKSELDTGVGDRLNMAHSSSTVSRGRGRGIVVFTGMSTEIGKIAESMQGKKRKPNRSLSRRDGGPIQPVRGAVLRVWDGIGKFLGLTEGTPLQRKLSKLAYALLGCALILAIIVFGANSFNVTNEVAIYAISTGIAIIPESLIAVLTITMVTGMTQMRKRKVVLRQLSALEALGGVTNICSDKTGTLTQGQMITRKVWIPAVGTFIVNGSDDAANPKKGTVVLEGPRPSVESNRDAIAKPKIDYDAERSVKAIKFIDPEGNTESGDPSAPVAPVTQPPKQTPVGEEDVGPELEGFLQSAALCNLATTRYDEGKDKWQSTGDPTEVALQVFAHRFDHGKKTLEANGWRQRAEYPFDSSVKRMSVTYQAPGEGSVLIFTKGAVERVLDLCSSIKTSEGASTLTSEGKEDILNQMNLLADQGLRVLAIAQREATSATQQSTSELPREEAEQDLTLLGLAGLYDPPRLETKNSVQQCADASVRVHMLTGDHAGTASAIAREVGILPQNMGALAPSVAASLVKTAGEFDGMTDAEIDAMPELPLVIARCAPDTKTRMIAALHRRKRFAAMTGDGVNDAPSLKAADVGIAMGLTGSDVSKGASDIVLTDDNFASIVNAVEEGRRLFDNIQKFILHLLVSNVAEVVLLIVGLSFQDRAGFSVFPLSPLQILWINMLTSSFPAFGLGREKAAADIMRRPPHDNRRGVFTTQIMVDMMVYGLLMGTCTLLTFVIIVYGPGAGNLGRDCNIGFSESCDVVFRARAAVFAELTWLILISAWELKSLRHSMFNLDPMSRDPQRKGFPFFKDVYSNRFLFFAVVIGAVSVFPAVYIPGLNTKVFKHRGITWEWGLSFGSIVIFVVGVESWKLVKRSFGLFELKGVEGESGSGARTSRAEKGLGLRQGFLSFAKSFTSMSEKGEGSRGRSVSRA
ncbi:MAG: Na+ ATPase [Caeruleum heppii]|nr:MAG: Na+ ATPase [Caeruleum heppii]